MLSTIHNNFQYSNASFTGYKEAKTYANITRLYNWYNFKKLYECNLTKLEGIQEGLKTFEGLSMKQIAFALTDLHSINVIRGCINHCLHCYANAQPFISRTPFESFKQIMDDIVALRKRIGINIISHRGSNYTNCSFDVDGIDTHLFDKEGKKHDAVELGRIIHNSLGYKMVFDTNGWDRNNLERQQIAEDYVKQLLKHKNSRHFYQINISLNPFNPKYVKAIKDGYDPETYSPFIPLDPVCKTKSPKEQKAEDLYREYIKNEVNTLFTFTPLLLKGKLGTIIRGLDRSVTNMNGCYLDEYAITLSNILSQLKLAYEGDLCGEQKVIKSEKMLKKALNGYLKLLNKGKYRLFSSGRMENLYRSRHNGSLDGIWAIDSFRHRSENNYNKLVAQRKISATDLGYLKMINSDGKVYLYDNYAVIPTDIQLKTGTQNLAKPFSIKVKDFVVTEDMIDRI